METDTNEKTKWNISIKAELKGKVSPEIKIKDVIDDNQQLELKISKDSVYANYELRF